jgi:hypothetical protein
MPFDNKGNYTPAAGSENATPGAVIRSATWNAIFTDLQTALTTLGNMVYTQNARSISVSGAVTITATDSLVEITVSVSVINLPASSLKLWPVRIAGNAAGVFSTKNSVITPNGTDKLSGQNNLTLTVDYQTVNLIPLPTGGWIVGP